MPPVIKGANGDLPEEITVLVNKSARMECSSSGNPAPRNSWQKDGQPLLEDEHHKFLSDGRILQVKGKKSNFNTVFWTLSWLSSRLVKILSYEHICL